MQFNWVWSYPGGGGGLWFWLYCHHHQYADSAVAPVILCELPGTSWVGTAVSDWLSQQTGTGSGGAVVRAVETVQLQPDLNGKVDLDLRSDHISGYHLSQLGQDLNGESGSGDQCLIMHDMESDQIQSQFKRDLNGLWM